MKKIETNDTVVKYIIEQAIVKGISLGKKNIVDINIESEIQSLSEKFTRDIERYSLAKPRIIK